MPAILLNRGMSTMVDEQDVELVLRHRWFVESFASGVYYVRRRESVNGKQIHIALQNEIMGVVPGSGTEVDHKNRDGLDNQRHNLREATRSQQLMNRRKVGAPGSRSSRFKGVSRCSTTGRWKAYLGSGPTGYVHLGRFSTEEEAAHAYNIAATSAYGPFANLNDVKGTPT